MICEGREGQVRICLYYYGHYLLSDELKVGLKYLVVIFLQKRKTISWIVPRLPEINVFIWKWL